MVKRNGMLLETLYIKKHSIKILGIYVIIMVPLDLKRITERNRRSCFYNLKLYLFFVTNSSCLNIAIHLKQNRLYYYCEIIIKIDSELLQSVLVINGKFRVLMGGRKVPSSLPLFSQLK